jgi:hypothetical protein
VKHFDLFPAMSDQNPGQYTDCQAPPGELASADVIWQHLWRTCATPTDTVCQVLVLPIPQQFLHLAVNFEDGFYIGEEVVIIDVETVKNSPFFGTAPPIRSL